MTDPVRLRLLLAQEREAFSAQVAKIEDAESAKRDLAQLIAELLCPWSVGDRFLFPQKRLRAYTGRPAGAYIVKEIRPEGHGLNNARKIRYGVIATRLLRTGRESVREYYFSGR